MGERELPATLDITQTEHLEPLHIASTA